VFDKVINNVNQEIIDLWKEYAKMTDVDINTLLSPLIYHSEYPFLGQEGLLFVSLNPSFVEKEIRKILDQDKQISHYNPRSLFEWKYFEKTKDDIIKIESKMRDERKLHFKKIKYISDRLGCSNYANVDLFFYRQTEQNEIEKLFFKSKNVKKKNKDFSLENDLTLFAQRQLEHSKTLITEYIRPKIIVVANTTASKIYYKKYDLGSLCQGGYYMSNLNGYKIPTILSRSFLYMETFKIESLIQQIKDIKLEKKC